MSISLTTLAILHCGSADGPTQNKCATIDNKVESSSLGSLLAMLSGSLTMFLLSIIDSSAQGNLTDRVIQHDL
jgi:hypothetical protein